MLHAASLGWLLHGTAALAGLVLRVLPAGVAQEWGCVRAGAVQEGQEEGEGMGSRGTGSTGAKLEEREKWGRGKILISKGKSGRRQWKMRGEEEETAKGK